MKETILVTGATGSVGSQVVEGLKGKGHRVLAAVHTPEKAATLKGKADAVELDLDRPETISAALKGVDALFLLTPVVRNMVEQGLMAVDAAKKAGVRRIVRLSGMGADIEPGIQLGRWHREIEKAIEASGITWTFLRPNSFMQNFVNFSGGTIKAQGAFYFPWGQGRISMVDVRDVAAAAAAALTSEAHSGRAYDITGPDALSGKEYAEILGRVLGRDVKYVDVPEEAARQSMQGAGMPDWLIGAIMELFALNKAGYTAKVTDAVERVAGRKPRSFEAFAGDYAGAFK
jgi:uncharacterized protein YbjT (DUF2867 family)